MYEGEYRRGERERERERDKVFKIVSIYVILVYNLIFGAYIVILVISGNMY